MKILRIAFTENGYKAAYAHWSGMGTGTITTDDPVLFDVDIRQAEHVYVCQAPWFVKTKHAACEAIMLVNDTFYDMRVTVNGTLYSVEGKDTVVVPVSIALSKEFIELCHEHAIYDIKDASKAYVILSQLTWQTGSNAFMEAI